MPGDLELLEQYEPTLCFAKSERFFPMAVEPYLERCLLFPSGPEGALEQLEHLPNPIAHMGELESEQFYLRFVNKPLSNSDARRVLLALSLSGLAVGWIFFGWTGIEIDLLISCTAALILFMIASPIRLRTIPSFLAVILFCGLSFAPILFFLNPSERIGVEVEYFIVFPLYVAILFYALMRILKFTIDRVIPEGPGMLLDMLSRSTEKVAREAYFQYAEILQKEHQPVYYGRVLREKDKEQNCWTILQYHFFYAFNDWRLAANGMNHHEGDWEMIAIYLKHEVPYAVLFSQHGAGDLEKWEKVRKVKDHNGMETNHPIVYVGLGSHANYPQPDVVRAPSMHHPGKVQRVLFWIDGLIHYLFLLFNPDEKVRQIALKDFEEQQAHFLDEEVLANLRDEKNHYVVRLPMEIATGDGYCIGPHAEQIKPGKVHTSQPLKQVMLKRKVTHPRRREWRRILLNSEHDWVQYKGLWGVKSWLRDESGPPGPRWDRPKKKQAGVQERIRWGSPLKWLADLEKKKR